MSDLLQLEHQRADRARPADLRAASRVDPAREQVERPVVGELREDLDLGLGADGVTGEVVHHLVGGREDGLDGRLVDRVLEAGGGCHGAGVLLLREDELVEVRA